MVNARLFAVGAISIIAVALSQQAHATSKPQTVKTAPGPSPDQNAVSLVLSPLDHPFCNISEPHPDEGREERANTRDRVHALLAPKVCPATKMVTPEPSRKWQLNDDPFIRAPFITAGRWNPNAPWGKVDQSDDPDTCLAGKADILVERAFRYGFCDATHFEAGNTQVDPTFAFGVADYYLINIVVWKGSSDVSALLSYSSQIKNTTKLPSGYKLVLTVAGTNCGEFGGKTVQELISAINADGSGCAKASLTESGQLLIRSLATGVLAADDGDVFGSWGNPQSYSIDSSQWYSFNHGDHRWYRQKLPAFDGNLRIYGTSKKIGFVAIHVKPEGEHQWNAFQS